MVFIMNESAAANTIFRYEKCIAIAAMPGMKKGYEIENNLSITYNKNNIIPNEDVLNAVVNGDIKAKKVIKTAIKALRNVKMENADFLTAMGSLMHLLASPNATRKNRQTQLVFVFPDPKPEDDEAVILKRKFIIRYLEAIFKYFDIEIVSKPKDIKKIFKIKLSKKDKKRIKKGKRPKADLDDLMTASFRKFMKKHKACAPSDVTVIMTEKLRIFFEVELLSHMYNGALLEDNNLLESKRNRVGLIKALADTFNNQTMYRAYDYIDDMGAKFIPGKETTYYYKHMRKHNQLITDTYNATVKVLREVAGSKLPVMPFGEKPNKKKPKKMKKFLKVARKEIASIGFIYTVLQYVLDTRNEFASEEFNHDIGKYLTKYYGKDLSAKFMDGLKEYNENKSRKNDIRSLDMFNYANMLSGNNLIK